MTCFNREYYKELKRRAKEDGVLVSALKLEKGEYPYNGYCVAFTKPRDGLRMIEATASYCAPEDKFKRKHGKYHALRKMYAGETVVLPLGSYDVDTVRASVEEMFFVY